MIDPINASDFLNPEKWKLKRRSPEMLVTAACLTAVLLAVHLILGWEWETKDSGFVQGFWTVSVIRYFLPPTIRNIWTLKA